MNKAQTRIAACYQLSPEILEEIDKLKWKLRKPKQHLVEEALWMLVKYHQNGVSKDDDPSTDTP